MVWCSAMLYDSTKSIVNLPMLIASAAPVPVPPTIGPGLVNLIELLVPETRLVSTIPPKSTQRSTKSALRRNRVHSRPSPSAVGGTQCS